MWQTVVVLLVLLGVLIYLVRHYARVYRADAPDCAGCSGCCPGAASGTRDRDSWGAVFEDQPCQDMKTLEQRPLVTEPLAQAGKPAPHGPVRSV
jgi:hypothetical protein